jgi:hypothetical protein
MPWRCIGDASKTEACRPGRRPERNVNVPPRGERGRIRKGETVLPDNLHLDVPQQPQQHPEQKSALFDFSGERHEQHVEEVEMARRQIEGQLTEDDLDRAAEADWDDCLAELRVQYGSNADRVLADAQAYVASLGSEAAEWLEITGAGSDKELVLAMADFTQGLEYEVKGPQDAKRWLAKIETWTQRAAPKGAVKAMLGELRAIAGRG